MATTYDAIASYTVSGSTTTNYTFTIIPQTYTDLVLVKNGSGSTGSNTGIRFNTDSGTHYSDTFMYGTGSTTGSASDSTTPTYITLDYIPTSGDISMTTVNIMNYANTSTYKTILYRRSDVVNATLAGVGMWRGSTGSSTEAITSITILNTTGTYLNDGLTLTLYGIKAA